MDDRGVSYIPLKSFMWTALKRGVWGTDEVDVEIKEMEVRDV